MLAPDDLDWFIWRLVVHPRISETLRQIETEWTLEDAEVAHQVLDAIEDAEQEAQQHGSN